MKGRTGTPFSRSNLFSQTMRHSVATTTSLPTSRLLGQIWQQMKRRHIKDIRNGTNRSVRTKCYLPTANGTNSSIDCAHKVVPPLPPRKFLKLCDPCVWSSLGGPKGMPASVHRPTPLSLLKSNKDAGDQFDTVRVGTIVKFVEPIFSQYCGNMLS